MELAQRNRLDRREGGCALVLPDALGCNRPARSPQPTRRSASCRCSARSRRARRCSSSTHGGRAGRARRWPLRAGPVIGVAQACTPIGEPYVITHAAGERDPADREPPGAGRCSRNHPRASGRGGANPTGRCFRRSAMDPAKSPLERANFLVRNLVGVRPGERRPRRRRARAGWDRRFSSRSVRAGVAGDLCGMLDRCGRALGGRRAAFGCYFDCAGRGRGSSASPDPRRDADPRGGSANSRSSVLRTASSAPIGRRNFFHNYTGALVIFPRPDPCAVSADPVALRRALRGAGAHRAGALAGRLATGAHGGRSTSGAEPVAGCRSNRPGVGRSGLDPARDSLAPRPAPTPRVPLVQGSAEALPFRDRRPSTRVSSLDLGGPAPRLGHAQRRARDHRVEDAVAERERFGAPLHQRGRGRSARPRASSRAPDRGRSPGTPGR